MLYCTTQRHTPPETWSWIRPTQLTAVVRAIRPNEVFFPEMYIFGLTVQHLILICEGLLSYIIIEMDVIRLHKTAISLTSRAFMHLFGND